MSEGTGEHTPQQPRIADRCPSCGSRSLFIGAGGWLTCAVIGPCKEPGVTASIDALRSQIHTLREAVRSLAHGEHSGRSFANQVLAETGDEL